MFIFIVLSKMWKVDKNESLIEICYRTPVDIGCFQQGPSTKFCEQDELPESPDEMGSEWFLYGPGNPEIDYNNLSSSVLGLSMDEKAPLTGRNVPEKQQKHEFLAVIVHGFIGGEKEWMFDLKDAILEYHVSEIVDFRQSRKRLSNQNTSVLIVKWTKGSRRGTGVSVRYDQASANTRVVGAMIAAVLKVGSIGSIERRKSSFCDL